MHLRRRLRVRPLTCLLAFLLGSVAPAQQSGHSTVPTSGPAAPGGFATTTREQDPVLARVEQLRRDLGEVAKRYRKMKGPERAERQRDLVAALGRVQAEVAALDGQLAPPR